MSAYSDYKCGAIDYDEFRSAMAWECRGDNDYSPDYDEPMMEEDDAYEVLCDLSCKFSGYDTSKVVDDESAYLAVETAMKCMERLWKLEKKMREAKNDPTA